MDGCAEMVYVHVPISTEYFHASDGWVRHVFAKVLRCL